MYPNHLTVAQKSVHKRFCLVLMISGMWATNSRLSQMMDVIQDHIPPFEEIQDTGRNVINLSLH